MSPQADFTYYVSNLSDNYDDYRQININNFSTNSDSYLWHFSDGNHSSEEQPVYQFAIDGTYQILLAAYNGIIVDTMSKLVELRNWQLIKEDAQFWARQGEVFTTFDEKLWVMGGYAFDSKTKDIWNSNDGISWEKQNSTGDFDMILYCLPLEFNNKIWLYGGAFYDSHFSNKAFNSNNGINWNEIDNTNLFSNTFGIKIVYFKNKLWMVGSDFPNRTEIYSSIDGINWIQEVDSIFDFTNDFGLVVFYNKMWIIGGFDSEYSYDVWSSKDGYSWNLENRLPASMLGYSQLSAVVYRNSIILTIMHYKEKFHDDIWKY